MEERLLTNYSTDQLAIDQSSVQLNQVHLSISQFEGITSTCPICFEEICTNNKNIAATTSCGHLFCMPCIQRSCLSKALHCPICRAFVSRITPPCSFQGGKVIHLLVGDGASAGITLKDCDYGCIVSSVVRGDCAFESDIRRGDVVTHVNGMYAVHHRDVINIVNMCTIENLPLDLVLQPRKTKTQAISGGLREIREKTVMYHTTNQ